MQKNFSVSDQRPALAIQDMHEFCSDPKADCNIRNIFLPNCRLYFLIYCFFSMIDFLFLVGACCVS